MATNLIHNTWIFWCDKSNNCRCTFMYAIIITKNYCHHRLLGHYINKVSSLVSQQQQDLLQPYTCSSGISPNAAISTHLYQFVIVSFLDFYGHSSTDHLDELAQVIQTEGGRENIMYIIANIYLEFMLDHSNMIVCNFSTLFNPVISLCFCSWCFCTFLWRGPSDAV